MTQLLVKFKMFHLRIVATSAGDDSSSSIGPEALAGHNRLFLFGWRLIQSESSGPEEAAAVPSRPVPSCLLSQLDVGQVT